MGQSFLNGFSRAKGKTVEPSMYWGDGHDGILTEGKTLQAGVDFTRYEDFAVLEYERIRWDPAEPETLTVDQPCRGLVIFVQGDVYVGQEATISMAKKGSIMPCNPEGLLGRFGTSKKMRHIVDRLKTLRGGAGGDGGNASHGSLGGTGGIGRICLGGRGGGGAGGDRSDSEGGAGGSVIYPELFGYGGHNGSKTVTNPSVSKDGFNGGGGGDMHQEGGGGGAPWGAGSGGGSSDWANTTNPSYDGKDGEHTGGFILIIARGVINIFGTLDVTGGDGGDAGASDKTDIAYPGAGGGGAGGGVMAIFARNTINITDATMILSGGAGGRGCDQSQDGTGGQQGTIYSEVLST